MYICENLCVKSVCSYEVTKFSESLILLGLRYVVKSLVKIWWKLFSKIMMTACPTIICMYSVTVYYVCILYRLDG